MSPEIPSQGDERLQPYPIAWVSREDLVDCCPELNEQIKSLDNPDLALIADKVGDALQESYWMALEIILTGYLGFENNKTGEAV